MHQDGTETGSVPVWHGRHRFQKWKSSRFSERKYNKE
jgi:hypothetical protein